jgi:diacylglycerol kinase (ATP)
MSLQPSLPEVSLPEQAAASLKNRPFRDRLGFAMAGIWIVFAHERSFRTQCGLAAIALGTAAALRVDLLWAAFVALSIGMVLALEMVNAALEYLIDRVHPELAEEIGRAKDAAAGAVLIATVATVVIAALMIADWLGVA